MIRPFLKTAFALMLAIIPFGSCNRPWRSVPDTRKSEPTNLAAHEQPPAPSPEAHLGLFGRDGIPEDVAFMGKTATDLKQHTTPSHGADFDPDTDPTGQYIVYASTRHSPQSHLYVKSVAGATITQITDGTSNDSQPQFDSSGKSIAFASDRNGQWDIWVIDANGKNAVQVTNSPMPDLNPSWSPDGRRIVYSRINARDNRSELWVVELDKPGIKRLIGEGLFPAWSPRGDKIAFQRAREREGRYFSIWTVDILDDEVLFPTEIASHASGALLAPDWSPDGAQLTFSIFEYLSQPMSSHARAAPVDGDAAVLKPMRRVDIGVVDVDGRGLQRLTDGHGECFAPAWSSDGRIYFSARFDDAETIWSVKPFRPLDYAEPPGARTTSDRRAAIADSTEDRE